MVMRACFSAASLSTAAAMLMLSALSNAALLDSRTSLVVAGIMLSPDDSDVPAGEYDDRGLQKLGAKIAALLSMAVMLPANADLGAAVWCNVSGTIGRVAGASCKKSSGSRSGPAACRYDALSSLLRAKPGYGCPLTLTLTLTLTSAASSAPSQATGARSP
jgi:hypothetical protein